MAGRKETMRELGLGLMDKIFPERPAQALPEAGGTRDAQPPPRPAAPQPPRTEPAATVAKGAESDPARPTASPGTAAATPAKGAESDPSPREDHIPIHRLGWEDLISRIAECDRCELHKGRTRTVPGVGDRDAGWMFIGEGPGEEEDLKGEPFVGPAGRLLDRMLESMGKDRTRGVYIANVVKCRPHKNRNPSEEEARACLPYLERQIGLVRPRIIVALGKVAANNLLGNDLPLGKLRGRMHEYRGIPLVVTYHPAYLLRVNGAEKRKVWLDLCLAMREAGRGQAQGE